MAAICQTTHQFGVVEIKLEFEWRWPDAYSEVRAPSNARLFKKGSSWFGPQDFRFTCFSKLMLIRLIIASWTCGINPRNPEASAAL